MRPIEERELRRIFADAPRYSEEEFESLCVKYKDPVAHIWAHNKSQRVRPFLYPSPAEKVVLDLGCGSVAGSYDLHMGRQEFKDRNFEPWLCRGLHELGIKTIGVDIGDLSGEEFEHYTRDLLDPDALAMIPNDTVDVAHARLLFSSPQLDRCRIPYDLRQQLMGRSQSLPPNGENYEKAVILENVLLPQVERVLKPGGVFIFNDGEFLKPGKGPYCLRK